MTGTTLHKPIKIWDPFVRIFHWTVVASFLSAWWVTSDPMVHETAGYLLVAMVFLRIAWGVVGPGSARFETFVRGPRTVVAYLLAILRGNPPRHLGHNPAGAAMIIALLAMLMIPTLSGVAMKTTALWGSASMEAIHGYSADLTIGLAALHVLGVLFASFAHRENLARSMVTGIKSGSATTPVRLGPIRFSLPRLTAAATILLAGVLALVPGRAMLDSGLWRGPKSALASVSGATRCGAVASGGLQVSVWPILTFRYSFAMTDEAGGAAGIAVATARHQALFSRRPTFHVDLPPACLVRGNGAAAREDRLRPGQASAD